MKRGPPFPCRKRQKNALSQSVSYTQKSPFIIEREHLKWTYVRIYLKLLHKFVNINRTLTYCKKKR